MIGVLVLAREILSECGWFHGAYTVDRKGAPVARVGDPFTLVDALNASPVTAARWEARLLLQRIASVPDLVAWNADPFRKRRDVFALLDRAIAELRNHVPAARRGGWTVTTTSPEEAMKSTQKKCPHPETTWPQPVDDRILACCVVCQVLVDVTPKPAESKRG